MIQWVKALATQSNDPSYSDKLFSDLHIQTHTYINLQKKVYKKLVLSYIKNTTVKIIKAI